jgi:hypothetical protein
LILRELGSRGYRLRKQDSRRCRSDARDPRQPKVTDKEYAEIENARPEVGEWCREVILETVTEAEADAPTIETLVGSRGHGAKPA